MTQKFCEFVQYLFKLGCFIVVVYMISVWFKKYLKDEDLCLVDYTNFGNKSCTITHVPFSRCWLAKIACMPQSTLFQPSASRKCFVSSSLYAGFFCRGCASGSSLSAYSRNWLHTSGAGRPTWGAENNLWKSWFGPRRAPRLQNERHLEIIKVLCLFVAENGQKRAPWIPVMRAPH